MKRRPLLKRLPLVMTAAGAGCTASSPGDDNQTPSDTETQEQTEAMRDTPTDRIDSPTTIDDDSPSLFEGQDCPSFDSDADQTICYHSNSDVDTPVRLRPSKEEFRVSTNGTVETVSFVLHNQSQHPFTVNPAAWEIHRRQNGSWSRVASGNAEKNPITVSPDETHTWSLSVEAHPTPRTEDTTFLTEDLEEGTYAFAVSGETDTGTPEQIEVIALVKVIREN